MMEPVHIALGLGEAAGIAAVLLLLCGLPWRAPRPALVHAGGVLAVGLGFFFGCWWFGALPHWRISGGEVQQRFLLVLLPAVVLVELIGAGPGWLSWLAWPLRLVIVAGAARVLLHGMADLDEWTPQETAIHLGGWACALAVVWALLAMLSRRTQGRSIPFAVALASAGAGMTVLLSAYPSGGLMGLALAAAMTGAILASLILAGPPDATGILSIGVVCLFALLISGHYFSVLTLVNAALLFFGPLLCWFTELPPKLRGIGRILLVAIPIGLAVYLAQKDFSASMSNPDSSDPEGLYSQPAGKG